VANGAVCATGTAGPSNEENEMEANFDNTADQARATGRRLKNDLSDGLSDIKSAASGEIKNLIADVEDLMARIADLKDADVVRVRGKVQRAVDATKQSLSDSADTIRRQAQNVASTADDYVRESPWQAIGIAALVGAVVGILATRRS
jgi:ElaB/YqjD/DUF883 family membrane-anchored ribosome-binding protein